MPEHNTRLFGRLDFDLTPKNTLTLSYKFKNKSQQNQGVGGFNLAERATDFSIHENEVKVFEWAFLSPAFLNELRFAFKDEPQQTTSRSDQPEYSFGRLQFRRCTDKPAPNGKDIPNPGRRNAHSGET